MEKSDKTYKNMVEFNRRKNEEKERYAILTVRKMVTDDKEVTIATLMRETGLSRSFFYNNPTVRKEVSRAREAQKGKDFGAAKRNILNKAMLGKVRILEEELQKNKLECESLKEENEKLKKTITENNLIAFQKL